MSGIRCNMESGGWLKSLNVIGSQITNTFALASGMVFRTALVAETPCRQSPQVGETRITTRTRSAARLNASRSASIFMVLSSTNAGCPAGAWPFGSNTPLHPSRIRTANPPKTKPLCHFIRLRNPICRSVPATGSLQSDHGFTTRSQR